MNAGKDYMMFDLFGLFSKNKVKQELDLHQMEQLMDSVFEDPDGSKAVRAAAYEREQSALEDQYGSDWHRVYMERYYINDCKENRRYINQLIYDGNNFLPMIADKKYADIVLAEREHRMREVYGDRYDELYHHKPGDPVVCERLIQDALKTGRWDELPEELQEEYKKRMFGHRRKL